VSFVQKPQRARRLNSKGNLPWALLLRTALWGLVAIAGATWALVRHATHELPPMRVLVPRESPTYDPDAGELPTPDLLAPEEADP